MPYDPDHADLHYDHQLADFSVNFMQQSSDFVFHQAAPMVPVDKESGVYAQYDRGDLWRNEVGVRRPGHEPNEGGYDITRPTYFAVTYDIQKKIYDEHRKNATPPLDPEEAATKYCTQQHMINAEQQWASSFFSTSIWDTDLVGAASGPTAGEFLQWDVATANPATQISTFQKQVRRDTGVTPNTLICGWNSWTALRDNDEIQDMYKHTTPGPLTTQIVASALELDRILVGRSSRTTSVEGATDAFGLALGEDDALLCYVDPNPGVDVATAMTTFVWDGVMDGNANAEGIAVATGRNDEKHYDFVQMFMAFDMKVVVSAMGVFFQTTNTL